ncbi:MAG TPA: Verru_Chthon cassette protein D [Candidatus Methylacidiphilales bacterium]
MKKRLILSGSPTRGFSLIEITVVLALLVLAAAISVPALRHIGGGTRLASTGMLVSNNLALARQKAVLLNRPVEVRLYSFAPSDGPPLKRYRALQLFRVEESEKVPVTPVLFFSKGIVLTESTETTSLLSIPGQPLPGAATGARVPGAGLKYDSLSFQFRPDGSTTLDVTQKWFLTLVAETDPVVAGGLPADFLTVQIDPASGKTVSLHP